LDEKFTGSKRSAIQRLIRAKSDREIARLLRQSHRLLNLHRRRRSSISHRERWTDYELHLLGRIRDDELAKLVRRGVTAVAGKRESLGIGFLHRNEFDGRNVRSNYSARGQTPWSRGCWDALGTPSVNGGRKVWRVAAQ